MEPDRDGSATEPHSKHIADRIQPVFENIISSEELPRQPGSLGSLSDHMNNSGQTGKTAQQQSKAMQSLQQITEASLMAERPRLRKLASLVK